MPELPNIPAHALRACLRERYDIEAVTLEFLPAAYAAAAHLPGDISALLRPDGE